MTRWHCWPKKHAAAALEAAVAPASRPRRFHRVAHAAIKPAAVAWTCIAIGWPVPVGHATAPAVPAVAAIDIPAEFFWLPPGPPVAIEFRVIGPAELLPDVPRTPVPEPGSLALLATGLVALVIYKGRKT